MRATGPIRGLEHSLDKWSTASSSVGIITIARRKRKRKKYEFKIIALNYNSIARSFSMV